MSCISPILIPKRITHTQSYASHKVPCNKCPPCKMRLSLAWVFRLKEEYKNCTSAKFITCTYEDQHLTWSDQGEMTINYKDHIHFINRLRMQVIRTYKQKLPKLKYFMAAEYGDILARPHFHYIIYNLPEQLTTIQYNRDLKRNENVHLNEIWAKGHVDIDDCNGGSISYVSGYMHKKASLLPKNDENDHRMDEKRLMSRGLGLSYLTPNKIAHFKKVLNPYLITNGNNKTPTPKYYRDKIYNDFEKAKIHKKAQTFIEKNCLTDIQQFEIAKNIIHQYNRKLQKPRKL